MFAIINKPCEAPLWTEIDECGGEGAQREVGYVAVGEIQLREVAQVA